MTDMLIDLHIHTNVSDGTDTPEETLCRVKDLGIGIFSVTDHDAIKSSRMMLGLLKKGDPLFICGVEFSCKDENGKYHILGYGYDPDGETINDAVEYGHKLRMDKLGARLDFLKTEFGIVFPEEETSRLFSLDNPGKPHLGNLMVKYGFAKTKEEAISGYINKRRFKSEYIRPETAISAIIESGGIPVLAHPSYGSGDQLVVGDEMAERVRRLKEYGLKGLECFYSGFSEKLIAENLSVAKRFGMYVTAGSDYHGKNRLTEPGDTGLAREKEPPDGLLRFLKDVKKNEAF